MKKFVLALFTFVAVFLLVFSTYRVLNGGDTLTLDSFLHVLDDLNFDFENLSKHFLEFSEEIEVDTELVFAPLHSIDGTDIFTFFSSLGAFLTDLFNRFTIFFELVYDFFYLFIYFVFDIIEIITSVVKMFFSFLGIKTRF